MFVFFDLVMAGLGVCRIGDIALSVLTTVIGHQREKGWTIVDAGAQHARYHVVDATPAVISQWERFSGW